MDLLARQHASTLSAVLVVLAWNVIMLLLLEVPIVAYRFAPEGTATAVESFKSWLTRDESRIAYWCTLIAGAAPPRDRRRSPRALTTDPTGQAEHNRERVLTPAERFSATETRMRCARPRSPAWSCRRRHRGASPRSPQLKGFDSNESLVSEISAI